MLTKVDRALILNAFRAGKQITFEVYDLKDPSLGLIATASDGSVGVRVTADERDDLLEEMGKTAQAVIDSKTN